MRPRVPFALLFFFSAASCNFDEMAANADPDRGVPPRDRPTNVRDVFFGDPLPVPLTIEGLRPEYRARSPTLTARPVRDGDKPLFYPTSEALDAALLPTFAGTRKDDKGSFDSPIVLPMSGTFHLQFEPFYVVSGPFVVRPRRPAYVQCLDATVVAGASTQTSDPFRARIGSCTMSRSGGETVTQTIAQASCSTTKGKSDCAFNAAQKACVGTPLPPATRARRRVKP